MFWAYGTNGGWNSQSAGGGKGKTGCTRFAPLHCIRVRFPVLQPDRRSWAGGHAGAQATPSTNAGDRPPRLPLRAHRTLLCRFTTYDR